MKKVLFLMLVMVGSMCLANTIKSEVQTASTSTCQITVVDEDGDAIDGVSIQVQNSSLTATTDANGSASLDCDESATFILSHSDYTTIEVSRNSQSELTVVMTFKSE